MGYLIWGGLQLHVLSLQFIVNRKKCILVRCLTDGIANGIPPSTCCVTLVTINSSNSTLSVLGYLLRNHHGS